MAANTNIIYTPITPFYFNNDSTSRNLKYHLDQMINLLNKYTVNTIGDGNKNACDFKINGTVQPSFGLRDAWCNGTIYFQNTNYDYSEIASAIAFSIDKFFVGKFYMLNGQPNVQWKEMFLFDRVPK